VWVKLPPGLPAPLARRLISPGMPGHRAGERRTLG
jgi:hypothetical protein